MHLEILAHLYANLFGRGKGRLTADAPHKQTANDRQIEGIKGCFEGDNAHVGLLGVLREVHCADGRCGDIQELSMGCLVCGLRTPDSINIRHTHAGRASPSSTEVKCGASIYACDSPVNSRQGGGREVIVKYLMEEVQKQAIVGLLPKVLLQDAVDTGL